jgi:hypothetical protein
MGKLNLTEQTARLATAERSGELSAETAKVICLIRALGNRATGRLNGDDLRDMVSRLETRGLKFPTTEWDGLSAVEQRDLSTRINEKVLFSDLPKRKEYTEEETNVLIKEWNEMLKQKKS